MKKSIIILILMCLVLCSCNKKQESNNTNKDVNIENLGIVKSDFGEECLLLKATNNSSKDVTVFSKVKLLDSSKNELATETGVINLYKGQSNYYIVEISSESKYDTYELSNEIEDNSDYKSIYNSIKFNEIESSDNETIGFKAENNTNKDVSVKVLGLFYKNDKIIAASVGICDNLKSKEKCEDSVYIPINSVDDYKTIDYDKVDLLLMDVSY